MELGYAMGQIHPSHRRMAFCIFDPGQGIYNSLRNTTHSPRHPIDAITMAVKEGVTRDSKIGQGNGMWGLHNIVSENGGRLIITSNGASYFLKGAEIKTFGKVPSLSRENGATTIDFQLDYGKGIELEKALGGHSPLNLRTIKLEDEMGVLVYQLGDKAAGTGTRKSGERIRNDLINLQNESGKVIELDFLGISVISSSFADELIGKLVSHYGFFGFNQIFRLSNMNNIVQAIVNRSVAQRMNESFVE